VPQCPIAGDANVNTVNSHSSSCQVLLSISSNVSEVLDTASRRKIARPRPKFWYRARGCRQRRPTLSTAADGVRTPSTTCVRLRTSNVHRRRCSII